MFLRATHALHAVRIIMSVRHLAAPMLDPFSWLWIRARTVEVAVFCLLHPRHVRAARLFAASLLARLPFVTVAHVFQQSVGCVRPAVWHSAAIHFAAIHPHLQRVAVDVPVSGPPLLTCTVVIWKQVAHLPFWYLGGFVDPTQLRICA